MEETDMIQCGQHGPFYWVVAPTLLLPFFEPTLRFHRGLYLCVTACDSGPIEPSPEEQALGWVQQGSAMLSPPLTEGLDLPVDQYDEWYILEEPPPAGWKPEVFVNCVGFTVVPVNELYQTYDPTFVLSWLMPIQERFWTQMERLDPVTYIATGDQDVVISKRREFIECVRAGA